MAEFIISLLFSILYFSLMQSGAVFSSSANHLCHSDEALALLQFKEMLHINSSSFLSDICADYGQYSYPKMISWNRTSADCCRWDGITCHEITGHVIALDLSCSRLMGVIHQNSTLFHLSRLQKLNLANNYFSQSKISPNFGGLTSLTHLNLSNAYFQGLIPQKISHLSKLVLLDLSGMNFLRISHRDFHLLLQNLTQIRALSLDEVNISTTLPANWSLSLNYLNLEYTGVYGKLSNSIFYLPTLQTLKLDHNKHLMVGLQKSNCCINPSLQVLDLSYSNCSSNGFLDLIGSLTSLKSLSLSFCGLSGSFPNSISNLSQIVQLDLSFNSFTGSIPPTISNLPKLKELVLSDNSFTGQFPSHIGNLTELTILQFERNSLSGPLPSNMSGLQKLRVLRLANNAFNGRIPSWLFFIPLMYLDLGNNRFIGQISKFVVRSLEYINFSNNQLDGPIPISIFKLLNLSVVDLSSNNFTGNIPKVIGKLNSLTILNLSHNKFSSHMLSTLGKLSFLKSLDLSWNRLEGEIPWQLANLTSLENLNLSQNRLVGRIPRGKQFNTFLNDSYYGNLGLCGFPMTKTCGKIDLPSPPSQGPYREDEDSNFLSRITLTSVLIGYGVGFAIGCLEFFTGKPKWLVRNIEDVCWYVLLRLGKRETLRQLIIKSRKRGQKYRKRSN